MKTADKIDQYLAEGRFPASTLAISIDESKHYLGPLCARGHAYGGTEQSVRGKTHGNCMICMRLNALVWKNENIDRAREKGRQYEATARAKELRRAARERWNVSDEGIISGLVAGAKKRSQEAGMPCNITMEYCIWLLARQERRCYWTGAEFSMTGPARHPMKPSIDRLAPKLGYTIGNIVLATNFANRARGDTPANEFKDVLHEIMRALHTLQPA